MARDHARFRLDAWDDPDFNDLTVAEQHAYWMLLSSRGLSRCGVLTFIPGRFQGFSKDLNEAKLTKAVNGLVRARFCVYDKRTLELLVRSYVRHDGVLDRTNMGKAVGTAYEAVASPAIREVIGAELARHYEDQPRLLGWKGLAETSPTAWAAAS